MEDNNKLSFKQGNPGSVQYGNFINYYKFNTIEERLKLLPKNIWQTELNQEHNEMICLDIGCNSGDLTVKLQEFVSTHSQKTCYMLGIDIDPILIERANEQSKHERLDFKTLDFMNIDQRELVLQGFLQSLGNYKKFNVIFCFSITMWIHLNNGDNGLKQFLKDICSNGEIIIIEPQSWGSYKTAVKRFKLSNNTFPLYKLLTIRNNVEDEIENILSSFKRKITETDRTKWKRKILVFASN